MNLSVLLLFTILIYLYKITINYKVILLFFMLFSVQLIPAITKKEEDNSIYFLKENKYTIIYDYIIKDNQLILFYQNDITGNKTDTLSFDRQLKQADIQLKNKQIYLGDLPITNSADRKLKPLLLNSGEIIYLSDKNRGIGFYTLRFKKIF